MYNYLREKLGKGESFSEYVAGSNKGTLLLEDIEEILLESGGYEGDNELVFEDSERDSAGEGPNTMHFETQYGVIVNKSEGVILLTEYGWNLDDLGFRSMEEYDGGITVYKLSEAIERYMKEYTEHQKKKAKERAEKWEIIREKLLKEAEEEKERKKEKRKRDKEKVDIIKKKLLEQGFEQRKSTKGNLISQFKKVIYQDGYDFYDSKESFLKRIKNKFGKGIGDAGEYMLLSKLGKEVCFKVSREGVLGVVKNRTSRVLQGRAEIYTGILNKRVTGSYRVNFILEDKVEKYKEEMYFIDVVHAISQEDKESKEEREKMYREIFSMFR